MNLNNLNVIKTEGQIWFKKFLNKEKILTLKNLQKKLVKNLLWEIVKFLKINIEGQQEREILAMLSAVVSGNYHYSYQIPNNPPKEVSLLKALNLINTEELLPIKNALFSAINQLKWNIDDGLFYETNSEIGNDYLNGNMHTELIGPKNGVFKRDDLRLGLFLLEPKIFYKDHKHEAPELYLNLSNGTSWRFETKEWISKKAGSVIYNKPFRVHAMKVSNQPFLAVWCWPHNSLKKCILVHR